jgi:hypothetical protein
MESVVDRRPRAEGEYSVIGRAKVPGAPIVAGILLFVGLSTLSGCRQSAQGGEDTAAGPGTTGSASAAVPQPQPEAPEHDVQPTDLSHPASAAEGGAPEPVSIPAETPIPAVMEGTLSTGMHAAGDTFYARVVEEILAPDGMVLVPEGARMSGRLVQVSEVSPTVTTPSVALTFESLEIDGITVPLDGVAQLESTKDPTGSVPSAILKDGQAVVPEGTRLVVRLRSPSFLAAR